MSHTPAVESRARPRSGVLYMKCTSLEICFS